MGSNAEGTRATIGTAAADPLSCGQSRRPDPLMLPELRLKTDALIPWLIPDIVQAVFCPWSAEPEPEPQAGDVNHTEIRIDAADGILDDGFPLLIPDTRSAAHGATGYLLAGGFLSRSQRFIGVFPRLAHAW